MTSTYQRHQQPTGIANNSNNYQHRTTMSNVDNDVDRLDKMRQAYAQLRALRDASEHTVGHYDVSAPRMLVLVGIPGSGKTTFARQLEDANWGVRVSQDDLGGHRSRVETAVLDHLKDGKNVIIDRCNFEIAQRQRWLEYAVCRGSHVGVVVFATPFQECLQRVKTRPEHPTLPASSDDVDKVLLRMANAFEFPTRREGFSFCRIIRSEDDVARVLEELVSSNKPQEKE